MDDTKPAIADAYKSMTKTKSLKKSIYDESAHEEIDPPLTLSLRAVGHSFMPGSQPFLPMIKFKPSDSIIFQPCGPGESVY